MEIINFKLMSNALNWIIVVVIVIFLFCGIEIIRQLWASAPAAATE